MANRDDVDWSAAGKKAWKTRVARAAAKKAVQKRKQNDARLQNIANVINSAQQHVSKDRIQKTLQKLGFLDSSPLKLQTLGRKLRDYSNPKTNESYDAELIKN